MTENLQRKISKTRLKLQGHLFPNGPINIDAAMVQMMAWYLGAEQATRHYLKQCWHRLLVLGELMYLH